jgi:hypothetical protein
MVRIGENKFYGVLSYIESDPRNILREVSRDDYNTLITIEKAKELFNEVKSNARLVFWNGVLSVERSNEPTLDKTILATGYVGTWECPVNCKCGL